MLLKIRAGRYKFPVDIEDEGKKLRLSFGYNTDLIAAIKNFQGAQWDGKCWRINNNQRNHFQLRFLSGENPYVRYDGELKEFTPHRENCYQHQRLLINHGMTRHYCIWAAGTGTGKSLSAIELMELSGHSDWLWFAPKSALNATTLELWKWNSKVRPPLYTYDGLRELVKRWSKAAPHGVIFDEASRLKNPTSQRSQAALHLANAIRDEWGDDGYVILMTGTPAPNQPTDWWSLCEVACPGYLIEGDINKFKKRLALVVQKESALTGGTYPAMVTWYDDEKKCKHCGKYAEEHDEMDIVLNDYRNAHKYTPSKNEIDFLAKRLSGLVQIVDKKTALDLPDKQYRLITVKPSQSTLRAANLIVKRAKSAIQGLILLRELSDGFQYEDVEIGQIECTKCGGQGEYLQPYYVSDDDDIALSSIDYDQKIEERMLPCPSCGGDRTIAQYNRTANQVPCPKEQVFIDVLDEHEDVARLVAYGGFTGTVDRMVEIALRQKWDVIRVDGRGWQAYGDIAKIKGAVYLLRAFQLPKEYPQKIVLIGQSDAAGMGLTLTASPSIFYYSNSFVPESRQQSEDRIHRIGMDYNRGATIIDVIHLPSDQKILDANKKKERLQSMTLGQFQEVMAIQET